MKKAENQETCGCWPFHEMYCDKMTGPVQEEAATDKNVRSKLLVEVDLYELDMLRDIAKAAQDLANEIAADNRTDEEQEAIVNLVDKYQKWLHDQNKV